MLEAAVTTYPIHRVVRCAARGKLEQIFDDLALHMGLTAHRLRHGSLFLDGPGLFVYAHGGQQAHHCSLTFNIWAAGIARATEARERLFELIGERRIRDEMFVLDWYFASGNTLSSTSLEEVAGDVVHDEAYPDLGEPVAEFIARFLGASETALLLLGTPGSGKTRLVRAILREISRRKGESAEVMYTADARALESDEIFVEFITRTHDAFVMEDADHLLKPRADGNHNLHRFLAIADGVVRAQGRKILFTTNLPMRRCCVRGAVSPRYGHGRLRTRRQRGWWTACPRGLGSVRKRPWRPCSQGVPRRPRWLPSIGRVPKLLKYRGPRRSRERN